MNNPLVLSLFPGIDLFGRAFEEEGWCVVRGPDPLWGGDICRFHPPAGHFDGVIGGPPCQPFSAANRSASHADGAEMLLEFARVVQLCRPTWALMENVPRCPNLAIGGYTSQRIDLRGAEVGLRQRRLRHFQFYSVTGRPLAVPRRVTGPEGEPAALASEGRRAARRTWAEFCALQGLEEPLELAGFTKEARYRAVGNGVPLPMGRLLARSIRAWTDRVWKGNVCECGCGRPLIGQQHLATVACRQRASRKARGHGVTARSLASPAESL